MTSLNNIKTLVSLASMLVLLPLSGCVSRDMSDLQAQVDEIMARPGGRIKPLPEIKPYEAYTYQSGLAGRQDPFEPFFDLPEPQADESLPGDGLTPEMEREIVNRNREELEQFELDSLRMVGTLEDSDHNWGIVLAPDGVVHRVKVGNYMGSNIGKITNIFEDKIELREIVQDSFGRWEEREAALALVEE